MNITELTAACMIVVCADIYGFYTETDARRAVSVRSDERYDHKRPG